MTALVDWLVSLPVALSFLVILVAWLLIGAIIFWAAYRFLVPEAREAGEMNLMNALGLVATFYAFLVGFLVVQEWSDINQARAQVSQEATALDTATFDSIGLPPPAGAQIRSALLAYDYSVICQEFPVMTKRPDPDPTTSRALGAIYSTAFGLPAAVQTAPSSAYSSMLDQIDNAAAARRGRINAAGTRLPNALLAVIVLTGLILLTVASLQAAKHQGIHRLTLIMVILVIAFGQGLVVSLSRPFASAGQIADAPLRVGSPVLEQLDCNSPGDFRQQAKKGALSEAPPQQ